MIDDYVIHYAGEDSNQHKNGVALMVAPEVAKAIRAVVQISDRVIMLQVETTSVTLNIIQVYAPTSDSDEDMIDQFYEQLEQALSQIKNNELTILMGDLNANIGQGKFEDIIGEFGLGA